MRLDDRQAYAFSIVFATQTAGSGLPIGRSPCCAEPARVDVTLEPLGLGRWNLSAWCGPLCASAWRYGHYAKQGQVALGLDGTARAGVHLEMFRLLRLEVQNSRFRCDCSGPGSHVSSFESPGLRHSQPPNPGPSWTCAPSGVAAQLQVEGVVDGQWLRISGSIFLPLTVAVSGFGF